MSTNSVCAALCAAGMTIEAACGMWGNMRAESSGKANIAQRGMTKLSDDQYTAAADGGLIDFVNDKVGYGLCQWTYYTRKAGLLAFCKARGTSVGNEESQVQFCIKELKENYPNLWLYLCSSHDLFQCTQKICREFEQPAVNNVGTRYEFAQDAFNEIAGSGALSQQHQESPGAAVHPADSCPVFPPDPSVMMIEMIMAYNGYWGNPTGYKTPEFFKALRQFVDDMEAC